MVCSFEFYFLFLFKKYKWKATPIPYPRTLSSLDFSIFNLFIYVSHVFPSWIAFFSELQTIILMFLKYICKFVCNFVKCMGFPVAQLVKNPPAMRETWFRSLGWEDPLEKGKATHSTILAWRIPWAIVHGVSKSQTRQQLSFSLRGYFKILIYLKIFYPYMYILNFYISHMYFNVYNII